MSIWLISLIVGVAFGLLSGIFQNYRIKTYKNPFVLRQPDGSVVGGQYRVLICFVLLWTAIGFGITYAIATLVKWIV